jgi:hypothetical protein
LPPFSGLGPAGPGEQPGKAAFLLPGGQSMPNEETEAECEKLLDAMIRYGWTQHQIEYFLKELDKAATKHGLRAVIASLERLG